MTFKRHWEKNCFFSFYLFFYLFFCVVLDLTDYHVTSICVNTRSTYSLNLGQTYPLRSKLLPICPLPLWAPSRCLCQDWPSTHIVIHHSNSSNSDEPVDSTPIVEPSPFSLRASSMTPLLYALNLCVLLPHPTSKSSISILHCLRILASMPGSTNILKKLDYDTLHIEEVNFLLPRFDGNWMFVITDQWYWCQRLHQGALPHWWSFVSGLDFNVHDLYGAS